MVVAVILANYVVVDMLDIAGTIMPVTIKYFISRSSSFDS